LAFLEVTMAKFTVECTYRIPVYRQRSYEADTVEDACQRAVEDDDWSNQKEDYESAGATYVSGAWPGEDTAYRVTAIAVPSEFEEALRRQADHFETLLGILKILAHAGDGGGSDLAHWRDRADAAIAKAEAILAGARDPT
jgi:hypothetical protein